MLRHESIPIPTEAPLMVLPGTVLFPGASIPLRIFEPRYRAMLEWSLQRDRMFCIATMKPSITEAAGEDDFHHIAGIGLIRASVLQDDGTSKLIIEGLARITMTGFTQVHPFRIASIEPMEDSQPDPALSERLADRLRGLCDQFRAAVGKQGGAFFDALAKIRDTGAYADLVANSFVQDTEHRQTLLAEPSVTARLENLIKHLKAEASSL